MTRMTPSYFHLEDTLLLRYRIYIRIFGLGMSLHESVSHIWLGVIFAPSRNCLLLFFENDGDWIHRVENLTKVGEYYGI